MSFDSLMGGSKPPPTPEPPPRMPDPMAPDALDARRKRVTEATKDGRASTNLTTATSAAGTLAGGATKLGG